MALCQRSWQAFAEGQPPHFPPQGDFPFFLSLTIPIMTSDTITISKALTMIVPIFAAIHDSISASSFRIQLPADINNCGQLGGLLIGLKQHIDDTYQDRNSEDKTDYIQIAG